VEQEEVDEEAVVVVQDGAEEAEDEEARLPKFPLLLPLHPQRFFQIMRSL
jgi:hypothetical protein